MRKAVTTVSPAPVAIGMLGACLASFVGCSHSPVGCFGIQRGKSYSVRVVERYDESSRFTLIPQAAPGEPENLGCGPTFHLPNDLLLTFTVLSQSAEEGCLGSFVQMAGAPPAFTFPMGFSYYGSEAVADYNVFVVLVRAVVGGCPGGLTIKVESFDQNPVGGDPFLASIEGGAPKFVLTESFQAAATGALCDGVVLPTGQSPTSFAPSCVEYYVVKIDPI